MDSRETMFLFEIAVEGLTSHINCREFCIKSQFADVFDIKLKDPNEMRSYLTKSASKFKRKTKVRNGKKLSNKESMTPMLQTGQSVLFANNVETLIANMKEYPMELSLWSKLLPDYKIGSTLIPWSTSYFDYLENLNKKNEPPSVNVIGDYNVFHETTSKRMAVIKLNVKLTYLRDNITTQFEAFSGETPQTFMYTGFNSKRESVLSTIIDKPINFNNEPGVIKTIYAGSTRNITEFSVDRIENASDRRTEIMDLAGISKCETSRLRITEINDDGNLETDPSVTNSIFIKSDSDLHQTTHMAIIKSKSCSTVSQEQLNFIRYIFGNSSRPFSNQIYCVGYFTVENEYSDSPPLVELKPADSGRNDTEESDRSMKSEKVAKSEKSDKSDISEKSSKSEKANKPATSDKSLKSVMSERTEKSERSDKSDKTEKSVKSDKSQKSVKSEKAENLESEQFEEAETSENVKNKYRFRICDEECPLRKQGASGVPSTCSFDISPEAARLISAVRKCDQVICDHKVFRKLPPPPDDRILLDYDNIKRVCCDQKESSLRISDDPCYCRCTCTFGFVKDSTFCEICGGYERIGEDVTKKYLYETSFPCPVFHKLIDLSKGRTKALSISGSDSKKKDSKHKVGDKPEKTERIEKAEKPGKSDKTLEIERDTSTKKGKKTKKDDRFKFNYGYTAPHVGHSRCALPCAGALGPVPKRMGWLWNAEDVPGMKYRPLYKPGAANKHVVRLLKIAKNPGQVLSKKRKKELSKGKRPLKRPLLIVQKKDGEYTVTMETMKTYAKPRTYNQYPYEDKPLVTYTIGRTEEENRERKIKKERAQRRLERLQREFIQSAFRDMCQEICLKTYHQALGLLPDAEKPDCLCYPIQPGPDRTDLDHSCSCSEDKSLTETDTDSDEWIVEFTPPNATFDPSYKSKKISFVETSTQYSYMDYRVKLLDRYGNPVPRFFKGPDGKQQCSDLGGFWSPENKWLEINIDGFIGPDEKWAPNVFVGPNGEHVDAEAGKFQTMSGKWLVVGIDGYVDSQGKWKFYSKQKEEGEPPKRRKKATGDQNEDHAQVKQSEATWSCFGSVSPKQLSKMGIVGHGHDKKLLLSTLQDLLAQGEDVKIPEPSTVPKIKTKGKAKNTSRTNTYQMMDRRKCKHATPSDKGIVAVDAHGNKTYFRIKDIKNKRPRQRIATLTHQGISLSSFHVPCFHSFISSEIAKKEKYDRLVALAKGAGASNKDTNKSTKPAAQDGPPPDFPSAAPYTRHLM
ncbi:uncharacterized protein LOC113508781 isoform X2 [Trichoplusia ni]|uniref:Uncharacterized protein LOC113508781 isoform X2 n=1 Tax=Trichoplusia ni TaxID=7111 RepID=A0A7E5X5E5_TRINI|nr:uncharacterized protein LOC113508781 isoform X2 [Trichoplusia ni]